MTGPFLPEGRLLHTERNRSWCASREGLRGAMASGAVLEGMALLCSGAHDLMVQVGPFTGWIPRAEAALGVTEGVTREIAILSRVGKAISFTVLDAESDPLLLSRRKAQEQALAQLLARPLGDVIPVTVTHLEPFGAFVDVGCGVPSLLPLEHLSVSRIAHPRQRVSVGQELLAVLCARHPEQGRVGLSHKALLGTWEENAAQFAVGMAVPGVVRGVKDYGVFVELAPNLSGLAEPSPGLTDGDRVSVYIKSIQPAKHKVKLAIIDSLPPSGELPPPRYFFTGEHLDQWRYYPGDDPLW